MNIQQALNNAAAESKHAALAELRTLQATLAASNLKVSYKEIRKRFDLSKAAYDEACRNTDRYGLVSADTLSTVIEAFADDLPPLPDDYVKPVPLPDDAKARVAEIRARLAAIPVRNPALMTVRRPMSQNSVELELATGLHEVINAESYLGESHALLLEDLHDVADNQPIVIPAGTVVAIPSENKIQILRAVAKGRAQFSDSPEQIARVAEARAQLESDLALAEAALVAAQAVAEAKRQEAERVRLATPIAAKFPKGNCVQITDATRELLHVLAAEGLAELVLPEA